MGGCRGNKFLSSFSHIFLSSLSMPSTPLMELKVKITVRNGAVRNHGSRSSFYSGDWQIKMTILPKLHPVQWCHVFNIWCPLPDPHADISLANPSADRKGIFQTLGRCIKTAVALNLYKSVYKKLQFYYINGQANAAGNLNPTHTVGFKLLFFFWLLLLLLLLACAFVL